MERLSALARTTIPIALLMTQEAWSRGVTPYLPINLAPEIERQIERVLLLANKPIMRRPIAAATVLDALPKACALDAEACAQVENYLRSYMPQFAITHLRATGTLATGDSQQIEPNSHGLRIDSQWNAFVSAHLQFNEYALVNLGGVAYKDRTTPTGSTLSFGSSYAQLDLGYRDHWLSPLSDSSSLISAEAPTMPSATLSNYDPISPLNISYEIFLARMSKQDGIAYFNSTTSGYPRLAGMQIAMEPIGGYALGVNRLFQYGGGARASRASQFIDAIFNNTNNADASGTNTLEFGNQVASITASAIFPGPTPFALHMEYAGEDNAWKGPYRLGATNMSLGVDFPQLFKRYDLSAEISEWQQAWYVHHIYPLGLTNEKTTIGHWFGNARVFGVDAFGRSASVALGARMRSTDYIRARYRTLANASYAPIPYRRLHQLEINYSTIWRNRHIGSMLFIGRDVFGESFSRISVSMDLAPRQEYFATNAAFEFDDDATKLDYFMDAGVNISRAYQIIARTMPFAWTKYQMNYHAGLGVRRKASKRNDLGVRIEFDEIANRSLTSLRLIDHRYRFTPHIATSAFFGMSRYQIYSAPAYGYYWGAGAQWTNLLDGWDLNVDWRHNDKLTRTKVLPSDPSPNDAAGIFIDTTGASIYLTRHF